MHALPGRASTHHLGLLDGAREAVQQEALLALGRLQALLDDADHDVIADQACAARRGRRSAGRNRTVGGAARARSAPPASITVLASRPIGEPLAMAARSMSPVARWHRQYCSRSLGAVVPLPQPGGPARTVTEIGRRARCRTDEDDALLGLGGALLERVHGGAHRAGEEGKHADEVASLLQHTGPPRCGK
jgi:hypothetical protein